MSLGAIAAGVAAANKGRADEKRFWKFFLIFNAIQFGFLGVMFICVWMRWV